MSHQLSFCPQDEDSLAPVSRSRPGPEGRGDSGGAALGAYEAAAERGVAAAAPQAPAPPAARAATAVPARRPPCSPLHPASRPRGTQTAPHRRGGGGRETQEG